MTFALLAPPVGLRPPYATSRAKPAPPINGSHYRKGGPCSAPIGGPVWTPIDTPAPFHVVPRGWAGPGFLAMLLFEKFGQHQPLILSQDEIMDRVFQLTQVAAGSDY